MALTFTVLGWEQAPSLSLDHRHFAYAGNYRLETLGKAVVYDGETLVAVGAVSVDRTDEETLWIRYLSVRKRRRGERIGPRLAAFIRTQAQQTGYKRIKAGVNNPVAYEAFYRAGFVYTGDGTGIDAVVLTAPPPGAPAAFREGLGALTRTDLPAPHRGVLKRGLRRGAPAQVSPPQ